MDWKWLLFSFKGRINRKPFWLVQLFAASVIFIPKIAIFKINIELYELWGTVTSILLFWPIIAVQVKR